MVGAFCCGARNVKSSIGVSPSWYMHSEAAPSGLNGGREVIKIKEFIGVARNVESEARDLLTMATWVVEV